QLSCQLSTIDSEINPIDRHFKAGHRSGNQDNRAEQRSWQEQTIGDETQMDRHFAKIVAEQHRLVEEQEKMAKAVEPNATKVVARGNNLRSKADGVEQSAKKLVKESSQKRLA